MKLTSKETFKKILKKILDSHLCPLSQAGFKCTNFPKSEYVLFLLPLSFLTTITEYDEVKSI